MKKFTVMLLICTLCLSLFCFIPSVAAEGGNYYYIKTDATLILEGNSTITGSINLPATWYVLASGKADTQTDGITYKYVEYNGILGKVDSSKLSKKTTALSTAPYFSAKIESISANDSFPITLYGDTSFGGSGIGSLNIGSSIAVVAITPNNQYAISYVQNAETKFAFIKKSQITNPEITTIENINKKDPDQLGGGDTLTPPDSGNNKTAPTNNILRILLIVGVCVLAVLLVFLIFKPSGKKAKDDDFYQDYRP